MSSKDEECQEYYSHVDSKCQCNVSIRKHYDLLYGIIRALSLLMGCFVIVTIFSLGVSPSKLQIKGSPKHFQNVTLRIQSWNLRYDSHPDNLSIHDTVENMNATIPLDDEINYFSQMTEVSWSDRRIGVINDVLFNNPDIFTVNEALKRQVDDLATGLPHMKWIGKGRDDGKDKGEFQAIFYNPEKVTLVSYDTIWLSETPFEPSKYPGAGSYRSATIAKFAIYDHLDMVKCFTLINLHLDDQSDAQRELGAGMAKLLGSYYYNKGDLKDPVFLVGDFNSQSSGASSSAYGLTTCVGNDEESIDTGYCRYPDMDKHFFEKYNNSIAHEFYFQDLLKATPVQHRMGHHATFTGFKDTTDKYTRIDFHFGGKLGNYDSGDSPHWEMLMYKVGDNLYDNSFYLSDHRPVISDILLY